ncbi:MAG: hypothetical protein HY897_01880 [Deltaproteobacteria bacterium]|nr:hypothetical protein [Deltaproteobacteria bacterium]
MKRRTKLLFIVWAILLVPAAAVGPFVIWLESDAGGAAVARGVVAGKSFVLKPAAAREK